MVVKQNQGAASLEKAIRQVDAADAPAIANVLRATRRRNLPYLPVLHSPEEDLQYVSTGMLKEGRVTVAVVDCEVVAFCACRDTWLDHLYVLPQHQRLGLGTTLLDDAKRNSSELQLWVFQRNENARRFYEKNGFQLVELTDGHSNEEHEPDARYVWHRPDQR
jgi:putative acetyltransferase